MAYRLLPFGIKTNKKIHAAFHILATASIIFGMVAVIQNKVLGICKFCGIYIFCGNEDARILQ